jgi:hydroxyacyl-ACP dehydratase HTD2-like protein with hotdog domain
MFEQKIYFEDVVEGMALPPMTKSATTTQLFLFSAVTWNSHRIHYDKEYAGAEGHPDLLVHGPLQGAWLAQYITSWMGPLGRLKKMEFSNRGRAFPGEQLTLKGRVARKSTERGERLVTCEILEEKDSGEITLLGKAVILLPSRS